VKQFNYLGCELSLDGESDFDKKIKIFQGICITLHVCGRNLITGLTSAASPSVEISSTCKVGHKLGVFLPLLTSSPSAWPSRLLYRRVRNFRRDLRIILYIYFWKRTLK